METVLDEVVSTDDLKYFERQYHEQLQRGFVNPKTQFEYAWCLVRSKYNADIQKGVHLLEGLCHKGEDEAKRDYLYYLTIGNAKLKEYPVALQYVKGLLQIEPRNTQAAELEKLIKKRMEKEGLMGMAIVGGAAIALGAIIGLGFAITKK